MQPSASVNNGFGSGCVVTAVSKRAEGAGFSVRGKNNEDIVHFVARSEQEAEKARAAMEIALKYTTAVLPELLVQICRGEACKSKS